jgi:thioredoxin reductase
MIDTLIIGAGIAGLSCARKLKDNNKKFKIITENVGGRIFESSEGKIEYGAYYIMKNYHYSKKFSKINRALTPAMIHFHKQKHTYGIFNIRMIKHIPQAVKFIRLLYKFKKHYEKFKKKCENVSQIDTLKSDPYLFDLYTSSAKNYINDHKISNVIYDFMGEALHGTTFTSISKLNAFTFLHFSLPLILPTYEVTFKKEKLVGDFEKDIIKDSVVNIRKEKKGFAIRTKKKTYNAKNVVVATPPHVSKKLLGLSRIRGPVNAHMFHLKGRIKKKWDFCEQNLFSDKNRMLAIAHQLNGTYLFYSKGRNPDFNIYFDDYEIITHKYWNPAFNLEGSELWECRQDENLYLIGDHNVCGLEDAFITGVYAAKQIIEKNGG